jgi:hypothetical protein
MKQNDSVCFRLPDPKVSGSRSESSVKEYAVIQPLPCRPRGVFPLDNVRYFTVQFEKMGDL